MGAPTENDGGKDENGCGDNDNDLKTLTSPWHETGRFSFYLVTLLALAVLAFYYKEPPASAKLETVSSPTEEASKLKPPVKPAPPDGRAPSADVRP